MEILNPPQDSHSRENQFREQPRGPGILCAGQDFDAKKKLRDEVRALQLSLERLTTSV